jgi:O-acetyl-ADP-ribose deacetylase (regulator of RNase III)
MVEAWRSVSMPDGVSVVRANILDLAADAIVSPANSFGFMDGGIDLAYSQRFGWGVQRDLQSFIKQLSGELLVGQTIVISTNDRSIPSLISAPTMRVPMQLFDGTNVYLATRAAILTAKECDFGSILMPGMGTGCGGLDCTVAAKAMRKGIFDAIHGLDFPQSWHEAAQSHARQTGAV